MVLGTPHRLWVVLLGTRCWSSVLSLVVVVHCLLLSVTALFVGVVIVQHRFISHGDVAADVPAGLPIGEGVTRWAVDSGGIALVESDDRGRGVLTV